MILLIISERTNKLQPSNQVYPIERFIAMISYLTAGFAGFIWMIIAALAKKRVTSFLLYHIMQSIFISIAYYLAIELYKLVFIVIAKIPIINTILFIFDNIINGSITILAGLSILQLLATLVVLYLAITSFMGQYSYLPYISDIISQGTNRK